MCFCKEKKFDNRAALAGTDRARTRGRVMEILEENLGLPLGYYLFSARCFCRLFLDFSFGVLGRFEKVLVDGESLDDKSCPVSVSNDIRLVGS